MKLLVVEDNPLLQANLLRLLVRLQAQWGYGCGGKALAWLELQKGAPARGLFLMFGLCSFMRALISGP